MEEYLEIEEQIIQYLEGEMDETQRLDFEVLLRNNPDLVKTIEEYKLILNGIQQWGDQNLKASIKKVNQELSETRFFEKETKTTHLKSLINNNVIRYAAAAIFLGLLVYNIFLPSTNKIDHNKIFAEYYKPDLDLANNQIQKIKDLGFIQSSDTGNTLSRALQLYIQGDYIESINKIKAVEPEVQGTNICQYFLGMNYIALEKYTEAEDILNKLCDGSDFEYQINACWNLSLTLIKLDSDPVKISKLLEKLVVADSQSTFKARELLKKYQ